jgi:hypothetical protein
VKAFASEGNVRGSSGLVRRKVRGEVADLVSIRREAVVSD